jgi:hypothetical protein
MIGIGIPISHNNIPRMVRVSAAYGGDTAEQTSGLVASSNC